MFSPGEELNSSQVHRYTTKKEGKEQLYNVVICTFPKVTVNPPKLQIS